MSDNVSKAYETMREVTCNQGSPSEQAAKFADLQESLKAAAKEAVAAVDELGKQQRGEK